MICMSDRLLRLRSRPRRPRERLARGPTRDLLHGRVLRQRRGVAPLALAAGMIVRKQNIRRQNPGSMDSLLKGAG